MRAATAREARDFLLGHLPNQAYNHCNLPCADAIEAVGVPRIYTTQVAPTGGPSGSKDISQYYIMGFETEAGLTGLGEVSDLERAWGAPARQAGAE